MAEKTSIEWTATVHDDGSVTQGSTWNPTRGCSRVSPGCGGPGPHGGCYAEIMAARFSKPGQWGHGYAEMRGGTKSRDHRWTGKVELVKSQLMLPFSWKTPRKIFVNSTSDLFHEKLSDEDIDKAFAVMALCPRHQYLILTKRAKRMREWFAERWQPAKALRYEYQGLPTVDVPAEIDGADRHSQVYQAASEIVDELQMADTSNDGLWDEKGNLKALQFPWPLTSVWLGVSVEDQERANERIPDLLATPAAIRFVSGEPLLKLVNFGCWRALDWIILGGESGPNARPFRYSWAKSIIEQCRAAGVACFVKQLGSQPVHDLGDCEGLGLDQLRVHLRSRKGCDMDEWPSELRVRDFPQCQIATK